MSRTPDERPWRAVKGMRDKVVHNHPEVDLDVLWATLVTALPSLGEAIRRRSMR